MARVQATWDIAKGAPNKVNDKAWWFSDSRGNAKSNGNYICWDGDIAGSEVGVQRIRCTVPGGMLAAKYCYIAKIYKPYVRESTYDYDKLRDYPVDLNDRKNSRRCSRKLSRIMQSLGVAYADRAGLMFTTNDIKVTGWFSNVAGKEGIAINPWVLMQTNMGKLTRLVKKEVVHRALYRNLKELSNKAVLNFTLDVLSMRVIATSPYEKLDKVTVRLAETLFNPRLYKKFPLLILADPSLTEDQVKRNSPTEIYNLWCELYKTTDRGLLPDLSDIKPSSLYFRIKAMVDDIFMGDIQSTGINYPWNCAPSLEVNNNTYNDDSIGSEFDKKNQSLNDAVKKHSMPRRYRRDPSYSNSVSMFMDEQMFKKKSFVDDKLKEMAKKLRTDRIMEQMESKLQEVVGLDEECIKPYPDQLSVTGTIMVALGISHPDVLPLWWNRDDSESSNRKKVAAYFDISPSMTQLFPYMIHLTEAVEDECDLVLCRNDDDAKDGTSRGAYVFAGGVKEIDEDDLDKMRNGKFKPGSSTSFDSVLDSMMRDVHEHNIDIVLIFTDGKSTLNSEEKIKEFNESGKRCYNIYLTEHYGGPRDIHHVESDLDKLTGESFTLNLPPVDKY